MRKVRIKQMPDGGLMQETPEQKLARYQAIYGSKGKDILAQESLDNIGKQPYTSPKSRYKIPEITKHTKAAVASASMLTSGLPVINGMINAVGVGGDLYTATRYLMDGQYNNAGQDYIQAGLGLIPTITGTMGMKGDVFLTPAQKAINAAITTVQKGSDIKTITEMEDGGKVKKDKNINGPIGYLNSYYNSDSFKSRAGKNASNLTEYANSHASEYSPLIMQTDPRNVGSMNGDPVFMRMAGIPGNHNVVISVPQANQIGANPIQDVLPHEYSHWTRDDLTEEENEKFTTANKNKNASKLFQNYKTAPDRNDYEVSDWMQAQDPNNHDLAPSENYSDLNAVRYMMYKQGIYDSRKNQMTKKDLEKAKKDPWLKNQFGFKRLLNTFNDEDIIKLNNEVAVNDSQDQNTVAKYGIKIMENGGKIKVGDNSITQLGDNTYSNPIFKFNGPSHAEGGIPIAYQGNQVEVEGDETGYIGDSGDLTVFGNMYLPGSNMKFKTASKHIAKQEDKQQKVINRSLKIFNSIDDKDDRFDNLTANSASVMTKSATWQQQKLTESKERLAQTQQNMLQVADHLGQEPKKLFGKAKWGKTLKKYADGGPVPYADASTDPSYQSVVPNYGSDIPMRIPYQDSLGYNLGEPIRQVRVKNTPLETSQISSGLSAALPTINPGTLNNTDSQDYSTLSTPSYNKGLPFSQIAPEIATLLGNRSEFVPSYTYQPNLNTAISHSFQDRLNANQSTFKDLIRQAGNNPAALSSLAAKKYEADNQVQADEFRTNESEEEQVSNYKYQVLNQAKLQNIQMAHQADTERSQNLAATRATTRSALSSISAKYAQNKLENEQLTLFNQLTPNYKFNPDSGQWEFAGGNAQFNANGLPLYNNDMSAPQYGEQKNKEYIRDKNGKVVASHEQKYPGIMKLFGKR